ncbi:MAG: helicase-exonuclease AddAB subunit AddA [Oscillospiraceae bacterium]|jgi:ATP-dependent helicase/nuclease subunit A|nr:helicase-exonuclease AddAB subunit AddA [Oscillospiraceae bacterium]
MIPGAFAPTGEQELAVKYRGGALLVSAAAGSGKTRVLAERLVGYITDPDRDYNIDEFLVITYTRAAADELRGRIRAEISARLSASPDDVNLRRQYALCHNAQIGTIHGFCAQLLRQNAHALGIPSNFRVADEAECALLRERALDDVIDGRCAAALASDGRGGGFEQLADMFFTPRGDRRLRDAVLDIYGKLLCHPHPDMWMAQQLDNAGAIYGPGDDAARTVWGKVIIAAAGRAASHWLARMRALHGEMGAHPVFMKAYGRSVEVSIAGIQDFLEALGEGWDAARARAGVEFPPARVSGYEELKDIRTACSKGMKKVAAMFEYGSRELLRDIEGIGPAVSELLSLADDFGRAYEALRRARGIVDFADLEHLALALLEDAATGEPAAASIAARARFEEILIDEYQDINAVQELIFGALSRGGGNIFMVGDARQSIYGFRQASPAIFLKKYGQYADASPSDAARGTVRGGRRARLTGNFRSRAGILEAVNYIFENIMSVEFGGMEYTRGEFLSACRSSTGGAAQPPVELDVLDLSEREDGEAEHVALRIEELLRAEPFIPDGRGGLRAARPSDFAILLRSVRNKAARYYGALMRRGLPAAMPASDGFFEAPEIMAAMALLGVIDNPMQDIPLISVLRGPIYGFTADGLADIRLALPGADFYAALREAARSDAKCREFVLELDALREAAPDMSADRFIFHVYGVTGLLGKVSPDSSGRERLMRLAEYARQYEARGHRGLFGFVSYMRRLAESGREPGESGEEASGDAVRIMSVHKSKGLEFPVAILADTAKRLNAEDMKAPALVHAELGVGIKMRDMERRIEYQTLPRAAAARALTDEARSEELRVLYVALTRAREKLIIVCSLKNAGRTLRKLSQDAARPVPAQTLIDASSMAEWILLAALTRPESERLTDCGEDAPAPAAGQWDMRRYGSATPPPDRPAAPQGAAAPAPGGSAAPVPASAADVAELGRRLEFVYPNSASVDLPSKLTVTELKGKFGETEPGEDAAVYIRERRAKFIVPSVAARGGLSGARRGTAIHLAMQCADYSMCGSEEGTAKEVGRLVREGYITPEQGAAADIRGMAAFFSSGTGVRLRASDRVFREFRFSLLTPARELFPGGGDDEILFQGVVDCAYESAGELTLIDFKTDSVTEDTLPERARGYEGQLRLYAGALTRVTGLPVAHKLIYFFALQRFWDVD